MKTLITLLSLAIISVASAQDSGTLSAKLRTFNIDPKLKLEMTNINSGNIYVNKVQKTITLQLTRKFVCPAGQFCPMMMPKPIMITLPITKVSTGACETVVYQARKDLRPVDGILQALTVVDNSKFYNHCRSMRPVEITEVHFETEGYNRMEREPVKTHSWFAADPLK